MYSRRQTQSLMAQHCSLAPFSDWTQKDLQLLPRLWRTSSSGSQVSSCATQKVWSQPLTIPWNTSSCSYNLLWLCYHAHCFLLGYAEHWRWSWDNSMQYGVAQGCSRQLLDVTWHSYVNTVLPFTKVPFQKLCDCCTEERLHGCHKPCPHQNYCTVVWDLLKLHTAYYQETYVQFWNRGHATLIRSLRLVRTLFPNVIPFSLLQTYEWTENTLAKY